MSRNTRFLGLVAASMLFACGGPPVETPDAGSDAGTADTGVGDGATPDAFTRDAFVPPSACLTPRAVTITAGAQTLTGDTTGMGTTLTRASGCGGEGTAAGSRQEVLALTLPGTASDMVGVLLTTAVAGTDVTFDTVVEVREDCMSNVDPIVCIDDGTGVMGDYRTSGTFAAPGGSTVFMIVRGYTPAISGYVDVGPWTMNLSAFINPAAPTFTSGEAILFDNDHLVANVMGMDTSGAAAGIRYSLLDAASAVIGFDLDGDPGTPDESELDADFLPSVLGMTTFTGTVNVVGFGDFPQAAMATQLRVAIVSSFADLESAEATFPIVAGSTVGVGAVCDATHRCADTLTCTTGVCAADPAIVTACGTATALTIAMPTTTTTSTMTVATLDETEGLLEGSCIGMGGGGDETFFTVTVPAVGAYDIIADTNGLMLGESDTVVYVRTSCVDPSTETGCNDDDARGEMTYASYVEVLDAAAGDHTIVVDHYDTLAAAATVDLTVSLRPVLPTAAPCDPMGLMNRCAAGACPAAAPNLCP